MTEPTSGRLAFVRRISFRYWAWGAGVAFALYMIVFPVVQAAIQASQRPTSSMTRLEDMSFGELIFLRSTEAFTTFWFFVFGATVGSYLNVVVYRSPRGESLLKKGSACPKCGSKIAGKDNIPVLGWIWLEGKCRDCNMPISSRYPIVEAVTGGLFLLFFFVELLSGGTNLPERIPNGYAGIVWIIFYTKWDLISLYLYHCLLLSALLTWALIRYDGQRVRWRSYATTFCMAFGPLFIWPGLLLVSYAAGSTVATWERSLQDALLTAGIGTLIGTVSGLIIAAVANGGKGIPFEREFAAGLGLVGTIMGWQAALSTAFVALAIRLIMILIAKRSKWPLDRWPLTGALLIAATLQLMFWRLLSKYLNDWWPVTGFSIVPVSLCAVAIVVLTLLNRWKSADTLHHSTALA